MPMLVHQTYLPFNREYLYVILVHLIQFNFQILCNFNAIEEKKRLRIILLNKQSII